MVLTKKANAIWQIKLFKQHYSTNLYGNSQLSLKATNTKRTFCWAKNICSNQLTKGGRWNPEIFVYFIQKGLSPAVLYEHQESYEDTNTQNMILLAYSRKLLPQKFGKCHAILLIGQIKLCEIYHNLSNIKQIAFPLQTSNNPEE